MRSVLLICALLVSILCPVAIAGDRDHTLDSDREVEELREIRKELRRQREEEQRQEMREEFREEQRERRERWEEWNAEQDREMKERYGR